MRLFAILTLFFFFVPQMTSWAQEETNLVEYNPDFEFQEGIFINFEQFKNNKPIPKSRILTSESVNDEDFFDNILRENDLAFYDFMGMQKMVDTKSIWGFSRNGVVYVNIGGGFNRVTIIGNICHFVANVTTYDTRYNDPYYANPYYNAYNNPYYYPYGMRPRQYEKDELRQYIMDMESGKMVEYNYKNLEAILIRDPELYAEYSALRKRKKKQLKFLYIRKFNERNPLYFPNKD